jgi:hypothetical protein
MCVYPVTLVDWSVKRQEQQQLCLFVSVAVFTTKGNKIESAALAACQAEVCVARANSISVVGESGKKKCICNNNNTGATARKEAGEKGGVSCGAAASVAEKAPPHSHPTQPSPTPSPPMQTYHPSQKNDGNQRK